MPEMLLCTRTSYFCTRTPSPKKWISCQTKLYWRYLPLVSRILAILVGQPAGQLSPAAGVPRSLCVCAWEWVSEWVKDKASVCVQPSSVSSKTGGPGKDKFSLWSIKTLPVHKVCIKEWCVGCRARVSHVTSTTLPASGNVVCCGNALDLYKARCHCSTLFHICMKFFILDV